MTWSLLKPTYIRNKNEKKSFIKVKTDSVDNKNHPKYSLFQKNMNSINFVFKKEKVSIKLKELKSKFRKEIKSFKC